VGGQRTWRNEQSTLRFGLTLRQHLARMKLDSAWGQVAEFSRKLCEDRIF
jgi:hypothetical protein